MEGNLKVCEDGLKGLRRRWAYSEKTEGRVEWQKEWSRDLGCSEARTRLRNQTEHSHRKRAQTIQCKNLSTVNGAERKRERERGHFELGKMHACNNPAILFQDVKKTFYQKKFIFQWLTKWLVSESSWWDRSQCTFSKAWHWTHSSRAAACKRLSEFSTPNICLKDLIDSMTLFGWSQLHLHREQTTVHVCHLKNSLHYLAFDIYGKDLKVPVK